jgi:GH24 family phage-related lysozyme (muramidase)
MLAAAGPGGNGVPKKVMDHLKLREGWRTAVYLDSRGLPTVGLGHLLTAADKRTYKVGDHVPEDILNAWAQADAKKAYNAGQAQAATLGVSDQSFINALASVNFQLGIGWYTKHKKTWGYLATYEWEKAAREAQDSLWYKQTPVRVQDFQAALRALAGTTHTPTTAPPAAAGGGAEVVAAASGAEQMSRLLAVSRNSKRPQGGCYAAVKHYIIKAGGYGNILNPYTDKRLAKYQHYAHDFADAIRALGPATFGLQELSVSTPFEAPAGALVVVKPRSPGTSHPTAGDITVADGDGNFYNDGVMHYHGPKAWPPKAGGMLGCFMPQ